MQICSYTGYLYQYNPPQDIKSHLGYYIPKYCAPVGKKRHSKNQLAITCSHPHYITAVGRACSLFGLQSRGRLAGFGCHETSHNTQSLSRDQRPDRPQDKPTAVT